MVDRAPDATLPERFSYGVQGDKYILVGRGRWSTWDQAKREGSALAVEEPGKTVLVWECVASIRAEPPPPPPAPVGSGASPFPPGVGR